MKILHVVEAASYGGASRAAARLHVALLDAGIDSVFYGRTGDVDVPQRYRPEQTLRTRVAAQGHLAERAFRKLAVRDDRGTFSLGWTPASVLPNIVRDVAPDVVHLHWLSGGVFDVADLERIDQPVVWSMHDMWAFTGGCHYDAGCGKHTAMCGACPALGSRLPWDASTWVQRRKVRAYRRHPNFTAIGLSRWLQQEARSSRAFENVPVEQLPNPIDTHAFRPLDRAEARRELGLPTGTPLLLFGTFNPTRDRRKGFPELAAALHDHLADEPVEIVVFGANESPEGTSAHRIHDAGRIYDDARLCLLYNACDATVVPSRQENLSNTIMESLACGTPVVAFDIGGNPDMVTHEQTGWLARPYQAEGLADGIRWAVERRLDPAVRERCRTTVVERFAADLVARRYVELYERIV